MKLLPFLKTRHPTLYGRLRELYHRARAWPLWIVHRSGLACALYYTLLSPAFRREQRAVVAGMLVHGRRASVAALGYRLRRNVHRLEKGLSYPRRKAVFGLDFIEEAIGSYERYRVCPGRDDAILRWADDVFAAYFGNVEPHPRLESARRRFAAVARPDAGAPTRIPGPPKAGDDAIGFEQFRSFAGARRSVRWFQDRPVERNKLDAAIEVAAQAPSSCNRQPFQYRVFDEPELCRRIAAMPAGTRGFRERVPVVMAVTGDLSAYASEADRHGIYVDASLSIMMLLLALQSLGLASCTINWPDVEAQERSIARLLDLQVHERVIMLVFVGYAAPGALAPYSQKSSLEQIRRFNLDPGTARLAEPHDEAGDVDRRIQ
jgi:nitroreductase